MHVEGDLAFCAHSVPQPESTGMFAECLHLAMTYAHVPDLTHVG